MRQDRSAYRIVEDVDRRGDRRRAGNNGNFNTVVANRQRVASAERLRRALSKDERQDSDAELGGQRRLRGVPLRRNRKGGLRRTGRCRGRSGARREYK